jgi:hypothetical protein
MDPVKSAQKVIKEQYGFIDLPSIESPRFVSLIRGTEQLANVTLDLEKSANAIRSMSVSFESGAQAGTNRHSDIKIPAWYCHRESLEKFIGRQLSDKEATSVALMLVNGSSIHEALHVAHSQYLWTPAMQNTINEHSNPNLFTNMLQLTEDLKNEAKATRHDELNTYIVGKNELLFTTSRFTQILADAQKKYGTDLKSIVLETLPFYKNASSRNAINQMLKAAKLDVAIDILEAAISPMADAVGQAHKLYQIFEDTQAGKSQSSNSSMSDADMEEAMQEAKEAFERGDIMPMEIKRQEAGSGRMPALEEIDVLNNEYADSYPSWHYEVKKDDFGFIKKLKVSRQVVPTLAEPRKSGSVLVKTRLSRIATDGKMFSRRGESVASISKKQPEYILLTDMSGSMHYHIGNVMETTKKMSQAMKDSGIAHAVYGHTSHVNEESEDVPTVFHIYSYRMSGKTSNSFEDRFEAARKIDLTENYDGHAINHVVKKFTRGAAKILLVLSDGRPIGVHYAKPEQHTIDMIKEARKQGITVISLSLVPSVIQDNNKIYGEKFNVDATTPAKLEAGLQKLILGK